MYLNDVIVGLVVTEKAELLKSLGVSASKDEKKTAKTKESADLGSKVYTFSVLPNANKFTVAKAVEVVFGVKVAAVRMVVVKSKPKSMVRAARGKRGRRSSFKKAYVTLKKGERITLFEA